MAAKVLWISRACGEETIGGGLLFIDYVPLLLINMAAGLCVLAHFIVKGLGTADCRPAGFLASA